MFLAMRERDRLLVIVNFVGSIVNFFNVAFQFLKYKRTERKVICEMMK